MDLPAEFNWAADILENFHAIERSDQPAVIWADMDSGAERTCTYRELVTEGNRCLNYLRRFGVSQRMNMYMMIPIVPETWFVSLACLKGGLVNVPTATSMTVRELQFRFESYPPDHRVRRRSAQDNQRKDPAHRTPRAGDRKEGKKRGSDRERVLLQGFPGTQLTEKDVGI